MKENPETELNSPVIQKTFLQFNLTDDKYQTLVEFGNKIVALLSKDEIKSDPNAVGLLDDLLGAIYCLIHAKYHGFVNRTNDPIEFQVVQDRASQIQTGEIRICGLWSAGWHFNSALYRIAAVYHRLFKLIDDPTTERIYLSTLVPKVKRRYKQWTGMNWSGVHTEVINTEVNTLKHDSQGIHDQRVATFEDALKSINELFDLIEAWNSRV